CRRHRCRQRHRRESCAVFWEFVVSLYTPDLSNLGAKLTIVSDLHLKYSRFWRHAPETGRAQHCVVDVSVPVAHSPPPGRKPNGLQMTANGPGRVCNDPG